MHNYRKLYFALLAGTILSTPANYVAAATLTPTLDTIKAEAAAEVEIAGVKYYFTPTGEDAALLKTLAGTVARNLVEDAGGIFEFDGKKYGFDVAAIPASVFEYAEGTESDYNFTILEADAEGNLTTKYYKVVLKPETFATSESIKWSTTEQTAGDASGSVEVKLPNNQTQTFYYAYTKPEGYTDAAGRINNTLATANVTNVVFKGISSSSNGGAIYNAENATIGDITGDFIGNSAGENGGAIYNGYKGTIGNITGDFINNETNGNRIFGGAIYNGYKGTIGDITGNFINNHTYSQSTTAGGAIENLGTINSISGNFINNYAQSYNNSTAAGGAIENKSVIRNITANFIGNHAIATNRILGAIYNDSSAVINSINGDFISNYLYSESYRADGSGIYNRGQIYNITGDFIGNYAHSGTSMAYGGAIYNEENIGDIVADFIGNYTQSESGQAQGGAIFNSGTINNITGDFIGNYAGAEKGNAYGGAIYNQAQITSSLPDNLIYHLTIKYGNEKAEIYTLPQGSELSANMQMVSGTLTVNSEYYFNQYKGKDIRAPLTSMLPQLQEEYALVESMIEQLPAMMDYIRDISVDDLTAEQYVDYLVMTGDMPEEQKEAALDAFNAMTEEQQAAAMVQAKEDITEAKQSVEIYDYVSAISVDNLTAEQYIDFAAMMAGGITEDQKEAALNEFNAMPAEEQAAAMVQAKEAITEIKEQMSGEAELNKIAEEIEQTENALAIIESGTPVTEITATVDTEGGINFYNSSFRDNYVKSENGEAKGGAIYGNGVTITADNYTSIIDGNKANDESNAF